MMMAANIIEHFSVACAALSASHLIFTETPGGKKCAFCFKGGKTEAKRGRVTSPSHTANINRNVFLATLAFRLQSLTLDIYKHLLIGKLSNPTEALFHMGFSALKT